MADIPYYISVVVPAGDLEKTRSVQRVAAGMGVDIVAPVNLVGRRIPAGTGRAGWVGRVLLTQPTPLGKGNWLRFIVNRIAAALYDEPEIIDWAVHTRACEEAALWKIGRRWNVTKWSNAKARKA